MNITDAAGVALRKESVDRNAAWLAECLKHNRSLSARRAWIEMYTLPLTRTGYVVALRKESVDRNDTIRQGLWQLASRSPQGERG